MPATQIEPDYNKQPEGEVVDGRPVICVFLTGPVDEEWVAIYAEQARSSGIEARAVIDDGDHERALLVRLPADVKPQQASELLDKAIGAVWQTNREHGEKCDARASAENLARNLASSWWTSWRARNPRRD